MPDIVAKARFLRMAPRKVRLVADGIRGKGVAEALAQLSFQKRVAAVPVLKLLKSAIANAQHNFSLPKEQLYVKSVATDAGPTLHRWRARAMGRAAPIRKRTAHLSLVLAVRENATVKKALSRKVQGRKTARTQASAAKAKTYGT